MEHENKCGERARKFSTPSGNKMASKNTVTELIKEKIFRNFFNEIYFKTLIVSNMKELVR
jgi:hypothetical protein